MMNRLVHDVAMLSMAQMVADMTTGLNFCPWRGLGR